MRHPNHLKFKGGYQRGVQEGVYVIVMEGVINNNKMLMYKFGHFILRNIAKIVATRYHIFQLKCTKFDFG